MGGGRDEPSPDAPRPNGTSPDAPEPADVSGGPVRDGGARDGTEPAEDGPIDDGLADDEQAESGVAAAAAELGITYVDVSETGTSDADIPDPGTSEPEPSDPDASEGTAHSGDTAELRQIDWLNRLDAGQAVEKQPRAGAPAPPLPPGTGDSPGFRAARHRDAELLSAGQALMAADTAAEALREVARLRAPGFELDGLVVFGVTEKFLSGLGQYGFRPVDVQRSVRIPMTSHYPAVDVVRTGRPVYLASRAEYSERYPAAWPLTAPKGRAAWAFLPLVAAGRITGVLLAAFRTPLAFTPDERNLLVTAARLVARSLERTRTGEAELALSRGLRRSMGSSGRATPGFAMASRYVPTGGGLTVGGDWYDSIQLPSGRLALVIGDVQGHDVHAAGLMAQLRTAVHAYAAEGHGPDAVLSRASRFLSALDDDRFATCIYLEADPATGVLQIVRAGHPHPVLRMADGTCIIKHIRGGLPLGLMPESHDYPVNTLELRPDEVLMLCTDGLIETGGHDMYSGWVRVRDAMEPGPPDALEAMADRLIEVVSGPLSQVEDTRLTPRNEDDIALLLLRRAARAPQPEVPERRLVLTIEQDQAEGLAEARAELRALLHDWTRPGQVDTAVLLASEALGNVLVHTDQEAALIATVKGEPGRRVVRVEVTDRGDELPHQRAPGELASSGRGLILLDLLSDEWSVRPEAEGKTVWFALHENGGADEGTTSQ